MVPQSATAPDVDDADNDHSARVGGVTPGDAINLEE